MLEKLRFALLPLAAFFVMAVPMASVGVANAQANDSLPLTCGATSGSNNDFTGTNCDTGDASNKISHFIAVIINLASVVVGIAAVIMIIVGGFRYVTSGGKQESVSGAKTTILYALVGLVVVALAQILVHFVLEKSAQGVS